MHYTQVRIRMVGRFSADAGPSVALEGVDCSVHPDDSDWFCTICNTINLGGQSACSNRLCARDRKVCGVAQASTRKRQAPLRFDQEIQGNVTVALDTASSKTGAPPASSKPPVSKRRAKAARLTRDGEADCSDATMSPPISPAACWYPPVIGVRPLSPESSGLVENIPSKAEAAAAAVVERWQEKQHMEVLLQPLGGDAGCEPLCAVPSETGDLVTCVTMPPKLAAKFGRKAHLECDLVESGWVV